VDDLNPYHTEDQELPRLMENSFQEGKADGDQGTNKSKKDDRVEPSK